MLARALNRRSTPFVTAVLVAAGVTAALSIGAATPSIWYDEAATISGAQRPLSRMGDLLSHLDMVHGAYYVFMHYWFAAVGYTPFTLRLPSLLASGATAGMLVLLGWRLDCLRSGLLAALVFTILPRTTYAAAQGRSYAIATLLVVAASLALVVIVQRSGSTSWWRALLWIVYAALTAAATVVFVYTALIVVAHAAYVLWRADWRLKVSWFGSAAAAGLVASPVVLISAGQTGQVGWLTPPTMDDLLVEPWSTQNGLLAGVLLAAVAAGAVVCWRRDRSSATLLVVWAAAPTLIVALVSLLHPLYFARYVGFTAPAAALLAGIAIGAVRGRILVTVSLVLALGLSLPTWTAQRNATANDGHDWQEVAAIVKQHRQGDTGTEVAVYGPLQKREAVTTRLIASAYPAAFEGLRDLTITKTGAEAGTLWAETADPTSRVNRLSTANSVWIISAKDVHLKDQLAPLLNARGFTVDGYWTADDAEIARYVRR